MEKLIEALKRALATTFAFRLKAQYYHWNVEGANFPMYHDLFGKLYTQANEDVDAIAEHIRALGSYAPGSFARYGELSSIQDETTIPAAIEMVARIGADNSRVKAELVKAHGLAEELGQSGVVNFLEGLIDQNEKTQWMLNATAKRV